MCICSHAVRSPLLFPTFLPSMTETCFALDKAHLLLVVLLVISKPRHTGCFAQRTVRPGTEERWGNKQTQSTELFTDTKIPESPLGTAFVSTITNTGESALLSLITKTPFAYGMSMDATETLSSTSFYTSQTDQALITTSQTPSRTMRTLSQTIWQVFQTSGTSSQVFSQELQTLSLISSKGLQTASQTSSLDFQPHSQISFKGSPTPSQMSSVSFQTPSQVPYDDFQSLSRTSQDQTLSLVYTQTFQTSSQSSSKALQTTHETSFNTSPPEYLYTTQDFMTSSQLLYESPQTTSELLTSKDFKTSQDFQMSVHTSQGLQSSSESFTLTPFQASSNNPSPNETSSQENPSSSSGVTQLDTTSEYLSSVSTSQNATVILPQTTEQLDILSSQTTANFTPPFTIIGTIEAHPDDASQSDAPSFVTSETASPGSPLATIREDNTRSLSNVVHMTSEISATLSPTLLHTQGRRDTTTILQTETVAPLHGDDNDHNNSITTTDGSFGKSQGRSQRPLPADSVKPVDTTGSSTLSTIPQRPHPTDDTTTATTVIPSTVQSSQTPTTGAPSTTSPSTTSPSLTSGEVTSTTTTSTKLFTIQQETRTSTPPFTTPYNKHTTSAAKAQRPKTSAYVGIKPQTTSVSPTTTMSTIMTTTPVIWSRDTVCEPNPCLNGGVCVRTRGHTHYCHCLPEWTGQDCTDDIDECVSRPCPVGSKCLNTRGSFSCECPLGYDLKDGRTCVRAKIFLGTLRLVNVSTGAAVPHHIHREILQLLNLSLSSVKGYSRSTVHQSDDERLRLSVVNIFSMTANVTKGIVMDRIQITLNNCSTPVTHCRVWLHHGLDYKGVNLCDITAPQCDAERTECTDISGTAFCQCRKGYFKHSVDDLSCRECGDGFKLDNGSCVQCAFGFGGFNCENFYKLIAEVVFPIGGGVLLIVLIILLVTCCRKDRDDINRMIFKSGEFPLSSYPKSSHVSMEWGRETIEMHENGSTKNLLQMMDIYYSPTLRSPEMEHGGLYQFPSLPGSRHSCIYPVQWNPSFSSDDTRRRDYF